MFRFLLIALFGTMISAFAGTVRTLDEQNFNKNIESGLVLVDFYADWCGPCRKMGPIVERVADEMEGDVIVYKVNVTKSRSLYNKYGIGGIPTLILFKDGKEVGRTVGSKDRTSLKNFIISKGNLK